MKIDRRTYADHYGPTSGDRIRLADTDLIIQIEHDATTYGDEAKFGGGKVIRDGMGQAATASRESGFTSSSVRKSCSLACVYPEVRSPPTQTPTAPGLQPFPCAFHTA